MRPGSRLITFALIALIACQAPVGVSPTPSPTEQATGSPRVTPTATPTPTPPPTPTPVPSPARCDAGSQALAARLAKLEADIEAAMAAYPGTWGAALVDLDCDVELHVEEPRPVQYTASAGKIVPIIAALRAVDAGTVTLPRPWQPVPMACGATADPGVKAGDPIDLDELEPALFVVLRHSCDQEADMINRMVTPRQIAEVLEIAKVSERVQFEHSWRFGGMTALDLARVWAALIDGRMLGEGLTTYLLDLASRAEVPGAFDTFPAAPDIPGHQFGQKAGYCVNVCRPYTLIALGAGFIRPIDAPAAPDSVGSSRGELGHGVAIVLMGQTTAAGGGPQRRDVFPLLVDYVLGAN